MKNSNSREPSRSSDTGARLGPVDVLILGAWCGLAAGELEVAARALYRAFGTTNRLYQMTRHFVWVVPLIDLLLFLAIGGLLALATWRWPQRVGWASPRLLVTLAILPALTIAGRGIYVEAWGLVAIGIAVNAALVLERHPAGARRWLAVTAAGLAAMVLIQAGSIAGGDALKRWREAGRAMPPAGSPDVLLIVMDTVRADRLSGYGYSRPTTPNLDRLAGRGVRFTEARSSASWTLPSHASMFSGRRPRELGVQWMTPLRRDFPVLSEYLGRLGYATAGFAANAGYCSYDTGIDRGFTHFEDYIFLRPGTLRTEALVDSAVKAFGELTLPFDRGGFRRIRDGVAEWFFSGERKSAAMVNRDFLAWLDHRDVPERPFFVFLNYLDAHTPYLLPDEARHRFGVDPRYRRRSLEVLTDWDILDKQQLPRSYWNLASDAYDDCLAYLDEQIGALLDELRRRGVLDRTLVIVTSDHGEAIGDHDLFSHGESLYRPETRVPLLILPPSGRPSGAVVDRTASLLDLPATVVDLIGLANGSPFPGRSLARFWADPPAGDDAAISELTSPNPTDPNRSRSPIHRGPMVAMAEGDLVYIRNEGDGREELYNERDDPDEQHNLARDAAMAPALRRFRDRLRRATTTVGQNAGAAVRVVNTRGERR